MNIEWKRILLAIIGVFVFGTGNAAEVVKKDSNEVSIKDKLGVCHINTFYNFTEKDFMNEGADKILELGTRVIKVIIRDRLEAYYSLNSQWPEITNLVQAAELPYFQELFNKPYSTYVLMTFAPGRADIHYFLNGMTEEDVKHEQDSYYEFTKYLLTKYKGTGKTFVLQNWEGDWVLTPPTGDWNAPAEPDKIQNMIKWLNARQDGVNRAREEVGMGNVKVVHAAEVNRVIKAMNGIASVTNDVLPRTYCDLYSYSAYDAMGSTREQIVETLSYLKDKAPDSQLYGSDNIFIGEYGCTEKSVGEVKRLENVRIFTETALDFGARYVLFWELYCDGVIREYESRPTNDDMAGNWLIRTDGSKTNVWDYLKGLLESESKQTECIIIH